ncbi:hypothetical protein CH63R_14398 [Colletotrichum higginsianum IMI 349063]|uniref:Uncharacterized protein n=1 Tax=Colletotrichum higginsianum (strain IMI 349063) TaxID=759273 RepID=A0A1B7XQR1_COLHI|nr:hypothetical protein CH63R_14398 [Colletotrichum higginsianum IMI 349063]OBR02097.1 hypothetical protein CH63R_14398 [Colletotrichum higginsianum IMI 349063]
MGVLPEELIARAAARGYEHGAYEERDSQANLEKYVNNTTAMHATVLNRYATWYWQRAVGTAEKLNAAPPDFTTTRAFVLRKNAPAPSMTEVKDFFRFYIASSCGARIGALFAGNVTYKRFDQRFVKNNRNTENDTFGSSARDHDVLLLSLAFADDTMFGFDSLESLYELEIPEGDNEIILHWNEDVLDLPIVRGIARDGTVTSKQLTESSFHQSFNKALKLAGYVGVSPSIHQIRCYLGKQVDGRTAHYFLQ